jgi:hypothetical protein
MYVYSETLHFFKKFNGLEIEFKTFCKKICSINYTDVPKMFEEQICRPVSMGSMSTRPNVFSSVQIY